MDVGEIVNRGYESKDLDYKQATFWKETDKAACCELVKDILAMANTGGGFIVLGVEERNEGFNFLGMSHEQLATFDTTRLNNFVQRYADPPINTRLIKHEEKFVVIVVPAFSETPHLCVKDYEGVLRTHTLYIRTDNNASAPLGSSSDFRVLLAQAVRNSHAEFLSKLDAVLKGRSSLSPQDASAGFSVELDAARERWQEVLAEKNMAYKSFVEFVFQPEHSQEDRIKKCDLETAARGACQDYRGWPFLYISHSEPDCTYNVNKGIETLIKIESFRHGDMMDLWRFYETGLFFQRKLLVEETHEHIYRKDRVLELRYNNAYFAEAIHCLVKLYEEVLPPTELVSLTITFTDMKGRKLVDTSGRMSFFRQPLVSHEEILTCTRTMSLAEWTASSNDSAADMALQVFDMFNWGDGKKNLLVKLHEDLLGRKL